VTSRASAQCHSGEKEQHSELRVKVTDSLGENASTARPHPGREHAKAVAPPNHSPCGNRATWQLGLRSDDYVIGTADGYF